jgi:hypothetical protein
MKGVPKKCIIKVIGHSFRLTGFQELQLRRQNPLNVPQPLQVAGQTSVRNSS